MQQVAAIKGAINGLMSELMEKHLHHHVLKGAEIDQNELEEFLKVLKDMAKRKFWMTQQYVSSRLFKIIFQCRKNRRFCLIDHRH